MVSATTSPREALAKYRTIVVVGASRNPEKDAYGVPLYLKEHGYRIVPVNPTADEIMNEKAYPTLSQLPDDIARSVEVVLVFRPSEDLPGLARQAVDMKVKYGRPFVFWAQLGIESDEAKRILNEADMPYVMNACTRVVHRAMTS